MLVRSLASLRPAVPRAAAGLASLRQRLQHLQRSNRAAEAQFRERRRLFQLLNDERHRAQQSASAASPTSAEATTAAIALLPRNDALEAAMALSISENRDARTELELVRRLVNSTLLSFASPVAARWDPYDVKPQVFAVNTYIALPVFTSIQYLRLFCQRFNFAVRDPSGVLWAAGSAENKANVRVAGLLPGGVVHSAWWQQRCVAPQASPTTGFPAQEGEGGRASNSTSLNRELEAQDCTAENHGNAAAHAGVETNAQATSQSVASSAPSDAPTIDADGLFDAMMMAGVAEVAGAKPTTKACKELTKRSGSASGCGRNRTAVKRGKRHQQGRVTRQSRRCTSGKRQRLRRSFTPADKVKVSRSKKTSTTSTDTAAEAAAKRQEEEAKAAYWQSVAETASFELRQATPLPTFGPFLFPFLVGYFADIATLLHNASIVPEKVDIVVNPASPIEFVLSRAATDRVLRKEQLLHQAYLKVEKELQREFSRFFALYCPEVLMASSACVPLPMDVEDVQQTRRHASRTSSSPKGISNALQDYRERTRLLREAEYKNGVAYEITILIRSTSLEETFLKIQQAKQRSMLMGHADLDVLPEMAAAPHVREVATTFFDGAAEQQKRETAAHRQSTTQDAEDRTGSSPSHTSDPSTRHTPATASLTSAGTIGVFERRGEPRTINVAQSADSYFHDPTNAYTEAHAVFTESLKINRGQ